ncbi:MAG: pyridoxal 5'-phosphate synthase glutaminase subunit PdxT [Actinomycetota bacterium]|nr:pyridoxal 5'-phosphate synthase glutaminase subunit PdxT [Actinomycetota bacterium]
MGVLALQGDVREHERALREAGATALVVKQGRDLDEVGALVLPGGESTTIGKLMDRFGLLEPLSERAPAGMPLYGTCAGMILMAKDIVGHDPAPHRLDLMDISVRRNAYGRQVDSFEADLDVTGLKSPFRAVFIRAPVVEDHDSDVEVLARWDDHPVLVRQGNLLASAFHPEMTTDYRLHELFVDIARTS